MDEEKDLYIKETFQKDKLISKKADNVVKNFFKEEFYMNEELKNKGEVNKKPQKWKKVLATAASLVVVFGAANVYATTQGYDNIFFMIKYLVAGENETIEGKDNILSDRDISISYEPINITEGISITIKKLQIKDNEAKLFIVLAEKSELDDNTVPLRYKIYNSQNELLCDKISAREEQNSGYVEDELVLENYKKDDTILKLEIYKANSKLITTLKINLEEKIVEVIGEEEALSKLSEIELKEFLGYVAGLSSPRGNVTEDEVKIDLACRMLINQNKIKYKIIKRDGVDTFGYEVEKINKMIESFYGETIENFQDGVFIVKAKQNGVEYYVYANPGDKGFAGECIDITNISYCNGLYTVTYTYYHRGIEPDADVDMNNYDIYQQTICIKFNENTEYSKFKIISMDNSTIIKSAENNQTNTNQESVNNDKYTEITDEIKEEIKVGNEVFEKIEGNWKPSKVINEKGEDVGLQTIWGTGIKYGGYISFDNYQFKNGIGITSDENSTGTYEISNNVVTVIVSPYNYNRTFTYNFEEDILQEKRDIYTITYIRKIEN